MKFITSNHAGPVEAVVEALASAGRKALKELTEKTSVETAAVELTAKLDMSETYPEAFDAMWEAGHRYVHELTTPVLIAAVTEITDYAPLAVLKNALNAVNRAINALDEARVVANLLDHGHKSDADEVERAGVALETVWLNLSRVITEIRKNRFQFPSAGAPEEPEA